MTLVFIILCAISVIDIRTRKIPDALNLALLACGIAAVWIFPDTTVASRFIGMFCISIPIFVLALTIQGSYGMGDVKLLFAAGFLLGWQNTLAAFCVSVVLGGMYGIVLLVMRKCKRKDHFAFGPFLAFGIMFALCLR